MADALGEEEEGFERAEERATLAPLLAHVSYRERLVLTLRFGEDMTQAEIGERIGVSQMQVSRLIRQALIRLRAGLAERPSHARSRRLPSDQPANEKLPAVDALGPVRSMCERSAEAQPEDQLLALREPAGGGLDPQLVGQPLEHVADARDIRVGEQLVGALLGQLADAQLDPLLVGRAS